ncbi:MAG: cell division protein FtsW [Candidatus Peribacteria bacterium]|nr:cell division protein FtsW [Candidatus Peribacteria bacterium]
MARSVDIRRVDLLLLGITVVLTLFGLAMIASVSVFESYQLTARLYGKPYNSFFLWKSFLHMIFGFVSMGVTAIIPYHFWERHARLIFFVTLFMVLGVFIPGIAANWGTSHSWVRIGPFSMQPAEFLKISFIFYLSVWLQKREQLIGTFKEGFLPFVTVLLISTFFVAIQPDLGSFLVISSIACVMFFIAGGNPFQLLLGGALSAVVGLPIILQKEYVRARFTAFLFPNDPTIAEGIGFQIKQALIAIGSGGFFGVGYGKSIQKFGYLPEVQADMIFSAMAEELGFMRLLIVLLMYGILVVRGYRIARHAPDRFGFLVASGITTWIAMQTVINISVNIGLFPITGLTLPFISSGGTSLLTVLAAVGILLNISMHSTEEATLARRTKRPEQSLFKGLFS